MEAEAIDPRQQRGLVIAQSKRIKNITGGKWLVPSQSSNGGYVVDVEASTCSCPDHETRAVRCKHLWAILFVRKQVVLPNGHIKTVNVTYRQNWPTYNAYQVDEKDRVRVLLRGLCEGIRNPVKRGRGRPRKPLADVIYAATMKTFIGFSGRRASTDIRDCLGIDEAPAYNTVFEYLARPELTPLLQVLVQESAAPIAEIDRDRAIGIDATGFATQVYQRWFDHKYGKEMKEATWVKLHIAIGTRSKIITAATVTDGTLHDSPQLPGLLDATAERFKFSDVVADKGYVGIKNLEAIAKVGAEAYIPFKSNNQGLTGPELWRKAFHLFAFHREEFLKHYHQRSNVEGVFSAMKRKFGPAVRATSHDGMVNEALLKCLCHNLSVLVRSIHELGIDPMFWRQASPPPVEIIG